MNDHELWNVSDRHFNRGVFLLDGFAFENCNFKDCIFALRGEPIALKGNNMNPFSHMKSSEIQHTYNIIKALTEVGIPGFVKASERLGQAAAERRKKEKEYSPYPPTEK
jgi:hypothetical protein